MAEVLFFVAAFGVIAGAIAVIAVRNPFYSVLALVTHLLSLAVLFLLLQAEFVAAAQVVVYAGAVMVLYVFVVAYVGGQTEPLGPHAGRGLRALSLVCGVALFVVFSIAVLGSGLEAIDSEGAPYRGDPPGPEGAFGTPGEIGRLLLTRFLLPFEVASFLLLIAAVGAVVLARRRGSLHSEEEQRISVADLVRPPGTGTMLEGVSGLTGSAARRPTQAADDQAQAGEGIGADEPQRVP